MSRRLVKSALFATGMHALLMVPLRFLPEGPDRAQMAVHLGESSVELELVGPGEGSDSPQPAAESEEERPLPPTGGEPILWESGQGALAVPDPTAPQNWPPPYPRLARINGWQGTVVLAVSVSSGGTVEAVVVQRSSGHAVLDEAALLAVRRWRFRPAVRGGTVVSSRVELPMRFRLNEK